jgi:hypothetical protein
MRVSPSRLDRVRAASFNASNLAYQSGMASCGMGKETWRGELFGRLRRALEYGIGLGRPLAMRAHEKMRDDRNRFVRKQLGAVPPHLDMTVRTHGRFEMLRRASETINHGAPRVSEGHNEMRFAGLQQKTLSSKNLAKTNARRRDHNRRSATLSTT